MAKIEEIPSSGRQHSSSSIRSVFLWNMIIGFCIFTWIIELNMFPHESVTGTNIHSPLNTQKKLSKQEQQPTRKGTTADNHRTFEGFNCTLTNGEQFIAPRFPHFIIAGAQKAGTSAIAQYFRKVPELLPSIVFEAQFFSKWINMDHQPVGPKRPKWNASTEIPCDKLARYIQFFNVTQIAPGKTIVYEKTPSLLALPDVPQKIYNVLTPHLPKIIIILRNPIHRLESHFRMMHRPNKADIKSGKEIRRTFRVIDKLLDHDVNDYHTLGFMKEFPLFSEYQKTLKQQQQQQASPQSQLEGPPSPSLIQVQELNLPNYKKPLARGIYSKQLEYFLQYFPLGSHLMVVRYEDFNNHKTKSKVLNDMLQFVGISERFEWEDELLQENLGPHKEVLNRTNKIPMSNETVAYLQSFYQPFNDELVNLLGPEWKNIWW